MLERFAIAISVIGIALFSVTSASAATTTIKFSRYCDGRTITLDPATGLYVTSGSGCRAGERAGIGWGPVNLPNFGQAFLIGENDDDCGVGYEGEYIIALAYPFVSGGAFSAYRHMDGGGLEFVNSGTYKLRSRDNATSQSTLQTSIPNC